MGYDKKDFQPNTKFKRQHNGIDTVHHDSRRARRDDFTAESIARSTNPNHSKGSQVRVHDGMHRRSESGVLTLGGTNASYIDAATGRAIVPGKDGAVAHQHPLAKAPLAKGYAVPRHVVGHKAPSNPGADHNAMHAVGRAVLGEALKWAAPDDRRALAADQYEDEEITNALGQGPRNKRGR